MAKDFQPIEHIGWVRQVLKKHRVVKLKGEVNTVSNTATVCSTKTGVKVELDVGLRQFHPTVNPDKWEWFVVIRDPDHSVLIQKNPPTVTLPRHRSDRNRVLSALCHEYLK